LSNPLVRKFGAELIGTFGLVFGGCASIIVNGDPHNVLGPILIALSFGVVIAIMVAATLHISGGHINPAVSIGLWATRHLPTRDLCVYLLAQLIGAILAALTLLAIFGHTKLVGTVTLPVSSLSAIQAVSIEAVATAFLVFVIAATATDGQGVGKLAPFAIGAAILVGALWAGPLTGGSFNPARSIGPALVAGNFTDLWMYIVGPIVGGIIGAVLYQLIRQPAERAQAEKLSADVTPREIAAARKRR